MTDFSDITAPGASFALSGPSAKLDPLHLPVRGDLAHIRLAGKVFVPHYVVPMAHVVAAGGAPLLKAGRSDAEAIAEVEGGALFNVLDAAGAYAWGQIGENGLVGYVALAALTAQP
ncbi:SH3 domain-containing protein [Novosphingobium flavum]|uniref:SH3 domain-containing protein n=1 Tax=Novosphingobium flavum TaxID=1778672 RepID=UPI001FEC073A|nr:SH3 domain-containing protein [Novosphingobium flavum]